MNTTSNKYIRLTKGLVDKGQLIPADQLDLTDWSSQQDMYASIAYYNQSHFNKFQETKSVKGITDVTLDKLCWDFDSKNDLELARKEAKIVVQRLVTTGIDKDRDVEYYFSGNKGYTLVVNLKHEITPEKAAHLAMKVYGKGLETLDPSLYNASRILRLPNSKHQETGLYKIQLTSKQFENLSIELIKEAALKPGKFIQRPKVEIPADIMMQEEKPKKQEVKVINTGLDMSGKPRHWKDYKWMIANGIFESGERHNAVLVLAATCRGMGYDRDMTRALCNVAVQKQAERTNTDPFDASELETNILDSIFSPTWNGGQFSAENDMWLKKYCEKQGLDYSKQKDSQVIRITDIHEKFSDYIKHIDENTIKTGIERLDKAMPLTTGMGLGLIGAASSGKTAMALKILENTSKAGVSTVMASLDMHRNRLFEKLMYRQTGLSREDLYSKFRNDDTKEILSKLNDNYSNVWFYDRSSPSVDDIRNYVERVQDQTGEKVKMVMIDYFERVSAERSDDTAASKEIAGKIQDMVNDLDICAVTLVQPNKFALNGGPDTPILNYTAIKGSSFLYQGFRSIISIWRPFFNPQWKDHDKFLQMAILKNDLGELDMMDFAWNGHRGEIGELSFEGRQELDRLLAEKENIKKAKDDDDGWK